MDAGDESREKSVDSNDEFELQYINRGEEQDFDISSFLYKNDPDFRAQCKKLMDESDMDLDEVLELKKNEMVNQQRIAYKDVSDTSKKTRTSDDFRSTCNDTVSPSDNSPNTCSDAASTSSNQKDTPYDKVIKNIESREKNALSKFKANVLGEQDRNVENTAKYSSARGKKKPTALVYAELSKENAKELQQELIGSQKQIVNDLWAKQEKFLQENSKQTLQAEKEIAIEATDRLVNGLLAGFGKKTPPTSPIPPKKMPQEKRQLDISMYSEDGYSDGLDSSYN